MRIIVTPGVYLFCRSMQYVVNRETVRQMAGT
jgi:hypothetical protein